MRRLSLQPLRIIFSLGLAIAGCDLQGTSTDTTNTLNGVVMTSDGSPAARAVVTVRSDEFIPGPAGAGDWKVLGQALSDSQGRFSIALETQDTVYLEAQASRDTSKNGSVSDVYFAQYPPESVQRGRSIGKLKLLPAGSLRGRIVDTALASFSTLRVGVVGFPAFSELAAPDDSGGFAFFVESVPAGALKLKSLVIRSDGLGRIIPYSGKLPVAEAKAGTAVDLGTIQFSN